MQPTLLIASPQMQDPFFERTVVLVWHYDAEGAVGVVVNRPLKHMLSDVVEVEEDVDLTAYSDMAVFWGGPVDSAFGTVVTQGAVTDEEGWQLASGLGVTRSQEALFRLLENGSPLMLCLGYAGWSAGQLDREIELGGWLWTDCDPNLVFEVPADQRYDTALATLGMTPETVWMPPIAE